MVLIMIAIFVWLYDDVKLLQILKEYSLQPYEVAGVLQNKRMVNVEDVNDQYLQIDDEILKHLNV